MCVSKGNYRDFCERICPKKTEFRLESLNKNLVVQRLESLSSVWGHYCNLFPVQSLGYRSMQEEKVEKKLKCIYKTLRLLRDYSVCNTEVDILLSTFPQVVPELGQFLAETMAPGGAETYPVGICS